MEVSLTWVSDTDESCATIVLENADITAFTVLSESVDDIVARVINDKMGRDVILVEEVAASNPTKQLH